MVYILISRNKYHWFCIEFLYKVKPIYSTYSSSEHKNTTLLSITFPSLNVCHWYRISMYSQTAHWTTYYRIHFIGISWRHPEQSIQLSKCVSYSNITWLNIRNICFIYFCQSFHFLRSCKWNFRKIKTVSLDKTMVQLSSSTATVNKASYTIQQNVWGPRLNLTWTTYMEKFHQ